VSEDRRRSRFGRRRRQGETVAPPAGQGRMPAGDRWRAARSLRVKKGGVEGGGGQRAGDRSRGEERGDENEMLMGLMGFKDTMLIHLTQDTYRSPPQHGSNTLAPRTSLLSRGHSATSSSEPPVCRSARYKVDEGVSCLSSGLAGALLIAWAEIES
jgi:hypothetical protein